MRQGVTPVLIPNTMVKTLAADGTALETMWESRWLPVLNGGVAQLGEHLPCKQGVMSSNLTISTQIIMRAFAAIIQIQASVLARVSPDMDYCEDIRRISVMKKTEGLRIEQMVNYLSIFEIHQQACKHAVADFSIRRMQSYLENFTLKILISIKRYQDIRESYIK